jgi:hypothetical protein
MDRPHPAWKVEVAFRASGRQLLNLDKKRRNLMFLGMVLAPADKAEFTIHRQSSSKETSDENHATRFRLAR